MENKFENIDNGMEKEYTEEKESMKEFIWNRKEKNYENVEINNRLRNIGVSEAHMEDVLEDWQEKITSSVENMCEKYPELVGKIGAIRSKKLPEGVYACAGPTMNPQKGFSTEIQVDSNKFSKHNLEWNVVGMERENMFGERWLAGKGVDGLIKHEIGHIIHLNMIAKEENLEMGEYDTNKYEKVYDRFDHNAIVTTMCYDTIKELGISPNDVGKELSTYGKVNFGEFFAEAISEHETTKNPRRISQRIYEKYEEYMKNANESSVDTSKEIRSMVEKSVTDSIIPVNKGRWEDEKKKGNSAFILDDNSEITYRNKSENEQTVISGKDLKEMMQERYGTDRVNYTGNEPDFSLFEDSKLGHVELSDFSISRDGQEGTFSQAEKIISQKENMTVGEVKQYMRDNNLTWHECGDCKTVRAIPTVINSAFKHTGGISIEKSKVAVANTISEKYGKVELQHEHIGGHVKKQELEDSLNEAKRQYLENKREL